MYEIKEVILKNGPIEKKRYSIHFSNPKKQIVGAFLMNDASLLGGKIAQEIKAVLEGKKENVEFSGNRCMATVTKDEIVLEDLYADVQGMESYDTYTMNTKELLQLIKIWLEKTGEKS